MSAGREDDVGGVDREQFCELHSCSEIEAVLGYSIAQLDFGDGIDVATSSTNR